MEILCIIQEGKGVKAFDTTVESFTSLKNSIINNDTYYIIAEHDGIKYSATLKPLLNKIGNSLNTWLEFTNALTVSLLIGNKKLAPICRFMFTRINDKLESKHVPVELLPNSLYRNINSIGVYSYDNRSEIEADFGSINYPTLRNLTNYKFLLKDIIFRHIGNNVINFNNVIPIINGVCTFPIVYNDELYARNCTQYLPASDNKNITLLDFSPVGNIETIKLSDCTQITTLKKKKLNIVLPNDKTAFNKTVILVLGGRLFFSSDISIISHRNIICSLPERFNDILISNKIYKKDYDNSSTMTSSTIDYYLEHVMFDENNQNDFVILIDNPNVQISYFSIDDSSYSINSKNLNSIEKTTKYKRTFLVDDLSGVNGFLVRRSNRDIIDFTVVVKESRNIIMVSPCANIVIPDIDIGYVESSMIKTYGPKLTDSGFDIINIFTS